MLPARLSVGPSQKASSAKPRVDDRSRGGGQALVNAGPRGQLVVAQSARGARRMSVVPSDRTLAGPRQMKASVRRLSVAAGPGRRVVAPRPEPITAVGGTRSWRVLSQQNGEPLLRARDR
jgi:hypothetical protein